MPGLRRAALISLVLVGLCTTARADQWDDLAATFAAQEHARIVSRNDSGGGVSIDIEHPLVTGKTALLVLDGKPAMLFAFAAGSPPSDEVFALMARGGSLITGGDTATVMTVLHDAYQAALAGKEQSDSRFKGLRHGSASAPSGVLYVGCMIHPHNSGLNFMIIKK